VENSECGKGNGPEQDFLVIHQNLSRITGLDAPTHLALPNVGGNEVAPVSGDTMQPKISDSLETETESGEGDSSGSDETSDTTAATLLVAEGSCGSSKNIEPVLSMTKRKLVDQLMEEFWLIFNQEWRSNLRSHTGSPSASTGSPGDGKLKQYNGKETVYRR